MAKRIAILQSNYIPWKGYFDLINMVDEFILADHLQFTRHDWRNRNIIKTPRGPQWLTIPVEMKGYLAKKICEVRTSDANWHRRHWGSITHNYSSAPHFKEYREFFADLFGRVGSPLLSQINYHFLSAICSILGITTKISWSSEYRIVYSSEESIREGRTRRAVEICEQAGATEYVSGPAAKEYIIPDLFSDAGIKLTYIDYSGYPEYDQLYPPFSHQVSILDLIFSVGSDAPKYMKSFSSPNVASYAQPLSP